MVLPRLAVTPEINNALLARSDLLLKLLAICSVLGASGFLLRQGMRPSGFQSLTSLGNGLQKRGRLLAALLSVAFVTAGIGLLGYALWRDVDLQPWFERAVQEVTPDILKALGRSAALAVLMAVGFYVLQR